MPSFTERFSEVCEPLAVLHADSFAIGNHNTAWVDMSVYHRAVVVIDVGDIAAAGTVDVLLQEATDNAGAGVQNIAGKAITQLTQAGGDSDDLCIIELRSEEMDQNNGYQFLRAHLAVAGNAAELSLIVYGIVPRYPPVPLANVTEVID